MNILSIRVYKLGGGCTISANGRSLLYRPQLHGNSDPFLFFICKFKGARVRGVLHSTVCIDNTIIAVNTTSLIEETGQIHNLLLLIAKFSLIVFSCFQRSYCLHNLCYSATLQGTSGIPEYDCTFEPAYQRELVNSRGCSSPPLRCIGMPLCLYIIGPVLDSCIQRLISSAIRVPQECS